MPYRLFRAVHGVLTGSGGCGLVHPGEADDGLTAGRVINTALADAFRACSVYGVSSGDFLVKTTEATGAPSLINRVRQKTATEIVSSFIVSDEFMEKLKFSE